MLKYCGNLFSLIPYVYNKGNIALLTPFSCFLLGTAHAPKVVASAG